MHLTQIRTHIIKLLLTSQKGGEKYGAKAMEDEIAATLTIENIDFTRDSVRKILKGFAPADESENRIFGLKNGLDFICDPKNKITEQNIFQLYQLAIANSLKNEDEKLLPKSYYRHDSVFIVSLEIEHTGLPFEKLPQYMAEYVRFINAESDINDLVKAAIIHFYLAYIHPYFDGNGRMARLIHLWFLVQKGFPSTLFVPFSSYIEKSRRNYYEAFSKTEQNAKISGVLDVTPFLVYFINNVYNKLEETLPEPQTLAAFQNALDAGSITEKEKELWTFVMSAYGQHEFSTKQLERDFANAAYATIRSFVLKFEEMQLLVGQRYGNKIKYHVK